MRTNWTQLDLGSGSIHYYNVNNPLECYYLQTLFQHLMITLKMSANVSTIKTGTFRYLHMVMIWKNEKLSQTSSVQVVNV